MLIDERVLTADFQPSEILHRHDEISTLSRTLQPISEGEIDSSAGAFIWGPTGTGKSCTTAYLLEQLADEADIGSATIDCWQQNTSSAVYHTLLNEIAPAHTRTRGTTAKSVLWEGLDDRLRDRAQFVVVLDEVDQLQDDQVLYQCYEHESITPILIANRKHDFFAGLDERVTSRLRGYSAVHFRNYSDQELVSILENRARAALRPDAVSASALASIAGHAHGDARLAIAILRNAVREAGEDLRDEHIIAAVEEAQTQLRQETLEKLSEVQRILFHKLTAHGEQSLSELYDRYCAHGTVDEPVVKRTVRKHLAKMADYDLVVRHGKKRGRTYASALEEQFQV
ncbi:Cdc6/Cdc18 family protein [Natronorubrum sp. DTA7]|uniref:Cdc6/Cdc18 family protein n=1 Tax=Natronorubrum sp. DTA7 TaxID=3447016 RepID=UPI003F87E842